ncbi:hypothetical protein [Bacillus cereus]
MKPWIYMIFLHLDTLGYTGAMIGLIIEVIPSEIVVAQFKIGLLIRLIV